MSVTLLFVVMVQASSPAPDIVVVKPKPKACSVVHRTGSRLRPVSKCAAAVRDPQEKIDEIEAERAVDWLLEQDRINKAACLQTNSVRC